jgi:hypothetical protein
MGLGRLAFCEGDYEEARTHFRGALEIFRMLGQRYVYIPSVLECLASTAAVQADGEYAARLWGAAESLREAFETPLPPDERLEYDCRVTAARDAMGDAAFETAWDEGFGMTLERAVAYGLAAEETPVPPGRRMGDI